MKKIKGLSKKVEVSGDQVHTYLLEESRFLSSFRSRERAMVHLHGGPGYPHNYLLKSRALASHIPLLYYDQLGCGLSDRNPRKYSIQYYVSELEALRETYKIEKLVLFGHSWGSILALEYYLAHQDRVSGIIFVSPCMSIPLWKKDSLKLRKGLSLESQNALLEADASYHFHGEDYTKAVKEYYDRYVYDTSSDSPDIVTCNQSSGKEVYSKLWGINEFTVSGVLKGYDQSSKLSSVTVPCMYVAGDSDEVRKDTLESYREMTPNADSVIIEGARHLPMYEQSDVFNAAVSSFLSSSGGAGFLRE